MEQPHQIGHWLPGSRVSGDGMKHAKPLFALYRTHRRARTVSNPQAFQLNSAYFASIDRPPYRPFAQPIRYNT